MNMRRILPLDFVKTPSGNLALVTETNGDGEEISLDYIEQNVYEKNAWWNSSELTVVNSLPYLLARRMRHPFGTGLKDVEYAFGK